MKDLKMPLRGIQTNYMAPFLGVSGTDSYETVLEKFRQLRDRGIYSATLQYSSGVPSDNPMGLSPFDDRYFDTLRRMSRVCRELGMTYWVQDAAPFPTGAANGRFLEEPWKDLAKLYLEERHTMVEGPLTDAVLLGENYAGLLRGDALFSGGFGAGAGPNRLLRIVALRCNPPTDEAPSFDGSSAIDLTAGYDSEDGTLVFSVPGGRWRVFFLYETRSGGRPGYMNLLDADSVRVNLEAVHELHYQQMQEELGQTWMGFFYDEPEVGNARNYDFNNLPVPHPGRTPGSLPWSREMARLLEERLGPDWALRLPELWYDCGPRSRVTRFHFMDLVTRLIAENYNGLMQPWCRERRAGYIGHVLEDENSHARLGCGPGHYFRFQKHQDMAGIDLVGGQLMPGMDIKGSCWYSATDGDGELYHYGIAKLAASEAAINPDKGGRSFCEVNAVYSSISNPRHYKYLVDHLLVSGVNHLIPVFTDVVNAPEGKLLFDYANRMCGLLDGSQPQVSVAVLYHAESEWSGSAQMFHRAGRMLIQHQLDFHVLPGDALTERDFYHTALEAGMLCVNGNRYRAIVVPRCDYIRGDVLAALQQAQAAGVEVLFVDALPLGCCERLGEIDWGGMQPRVVPLEALGEALTPVLRCCPAAPYLRCSWFRKDGLDWFYLVNTGYRAPIRTTLTLPVCGELRQYDPMLDRQTPVCFRLTEGRLSIPVSLGQWESVLYVVDTQAAPGISPVEVLRTPAVCSPWTVTFADGRAPMTLPALADLGAMPGLRRYVQPLRYRTTLRVDGPLPRQLDLGQVGDSASVTLNGQPLGLRIAAPYVFDLDGAVRSGENRLEIEILPTQARRRAVPTGSPMDTLFDSVGATVYAVMPPVGLLGPVECIE